MAPRPRRAAANKANTAITDMTDSDSKNINTNNNASGRSSRNMSSRTSSRRTEGKSDVAVSRGPPSSPSDSNQHIHVTVKLPASKLRQATSSRQGASVASREGLVGGEILQGKRNRNQKKSYVLESSEDDEDAPGEDEDAEGEDEEMEDDAQGEIIVDDSMDLDAEEEDDDLDMDAEGEDDDMESMPPAASSINVSKPTKSVPAPKPKTTPVKSLARPVVPAKDSDDDELSELESDEDEEIQDTVKVGGGDLVDDDAEGEEDDEIEAAGPVEEEDDDLDSDGSRAETPDLAKMTKRQRARFEDGDGGLMKLSDEVQAKKHFTAEEISMRRLEMARRRRNLSEKRNEEVKNQTINKLLKKQAPKTTRKAQIAGDDTPDGEVQTKPNPVFIRWTSDKNGSRVSVPEEMLGGDAGRIFGPGGLRSGKTVEEVL